MKFNFRNVKPKFCWFCQLLWQRETVGWLGLLTHTCCAETAASTPVTGSTFCQFLVFLPSWSTGLLEFAPADPRKSPSPLSAKDLAFGHHHVTLYANFQVFLLGSCQAKQAVLYHCLLPSFGT